jgi:hypothetical protein
MDTVGAMASSRYLMMASAHAGVGSAAAAAASSAVAETAAKVAQAGAAVRQHADAFTLKLPDAVGKAIQRLVNETLSDLPPNGGRAKQEEVPATGVEVYA